MVKLNEVKSSNINAIGWEKDTLYVKYTSGTYAYYEVPEALYEGLLKAESKGSYMNSYIKGHYEYDRLPEDGLC